MSSLLGERRKEIELVERFPHQSRDPDTYTYMHRTKGIRYNYLQQGQEYLLKWTLHETANDGAYHIGMERTVMHCQFLKYFDNRLYTRFLEYLNFRDKKQLEKEFEDLFEKGILVAVQPLEMSGEGLDIFIHDRIDYVTDALSPFYHISRDRLLGPHLGLFCVITLRNCYPKTDMLQDYVLYSFLRAAGCVSFRNEFPSNQRHYIWSQRITQLYVWVDLHQVEIRPTLSTYRLINAKQKAIENAAAKFFKQNQRFCHLPQAIKELILSYLVEPFP
jgi:hypothetical protein